MTYLIAIFCPPLYFLIKKQWVGFCVSTLLLVLCFFMAKAYGLYGAATSLLLSEIVMNVYVLPASLRIAHDTFPAFIASMLDYPQFLRPAALLARIRRSQPGLES